MALPVAALRGVTFDPVEVIAYVQAPLLGEACGVNSSDAATGEPVEVPPTISTLLFFVNRYA